eukprot:SAG11_NODE_19384_length_468_cov_0.449864_1_plen_60_part_10
MTPKILAMKGATGASKRGYLLNVGMSDKWVEKYVIYVIKSVRYRVADKAKPEPPLQHILV